MLSVWFRSQRRNALFHNELPCCFCGRRVCIHVHAFWPAWGRIIQRDATHDLHRDATRDATRATQTPTGLAPRLNPASNLTILGRKKTWVRFTRSTHAKTFGCDTPVRDKPSCPGPALRNAPSGRVRFYQCRSVLIRYKSRRKIVSVTA